MREQSPASAAVIVAKYARSTKQTRAADMCDKQKACAKQIKRNAKDSKGFGILVGKEAVCTIAIHVVAAHPLWGGGGCVGGWPKRWRLIIAMSPTCHPTHSCADTRFVPLMMKIHPLRCWWHILLYYMRVHHTAFFRQLINFPPASKLVSRDIYSHRGFTFIFEKYKISHMILLRLHRLESK